MGRGVESIEITGIAAGGAGVGRLADGRVTFVHRTAPGDLARVRVVEERRRWTRSRLLSLERPGPGRRDAPCEHYDRCGGCTLEHLSYPSQLIAKARVVADALDRIGGLGGVETEVAPAPAEFRYRNRVTFTLRRAPNGVVAGFHEVDAPDRIVDLSAGCLLPEPAIARVWARLRECWGPDASRLPSGDELRLTLRASEAGQVTLAVHGGYGPGRPAELVDAVPDLLAVWHRPATADTFTMVAGDDTLHERWAGDEIELSGDVFTQVNRAAARMLEGHVLDRVHAASPSRVLDAYCGVGLHARRLGRAGVEVVGIEAHPDAVAEARRAAPAARLLEGRVEDRIAEALPVDLAILNPPRAGLDPAVIDGLRAAPPATILYVSCDPATLARDLARMAPDWRLAGVRCFDLFPQTAHVETVAELRCATS